MARTSILGKFRCCDRCDRMRHVSDLVYSQWTHRYYCWRDVEGCARRSRQLGGQAWQDGSLHLFGPGVGHARKPKAVAA